MFKPCRITEGNTEKESLMVQSQVIDCCFSQAQDGKVLHTFGHDLDCNVHVHLSITCGGSTLFSRLSSLLLSIENRG
ncbi:transposase [Endozoicomonas sp. ISHI1]|uniref:transposase n=1 Tax=Endozoicomonas sp. ISHI1 TaxID=2825882 RepID=UPI0035A10549